MTRILAATLLCALALLLPTPAVAQMGGSSAGAVSALSVNARLGYDTDLDAFAVGGAVRVPALRLPIELQAAYDLTFLDVLTERQLSLDALYRAGAGVAVGGGLAFRNSIYPVDGVVDLDGPRDTRRGYSLVLALGGTPRRDSPVVAGVELRFTWVEDFTPRTIMAQVGLPLLRF